MIVIKNIPGLTLGELIATLRAVADPAERPPRTGDGGVVVGERTALEWLAAYLPAVAPPPPPPVAFQPAPIPAAPDPIPAAPDLAPTPAGATEPDDTPPRPRPRRGAARKTATNPTSAGAGGRHGGDL